MDGFDTALLHVEVKRPLILQIERDMCGDSALALKRGAVIDLAKEIEAVLESRFFIEDCDLLVVRVAIEGGH